MLWIFGLKRAKIHVFSNFSTVRKQHFKNVDFLCSSEYFSRNTKEKSKFLEILRNKNTSISKICSFLKNFFLLQRIYVLAYFSQFFSIFPLALYLSGKMHIWTWVYYIIYAKIFSLGPLAILWRDIFYDRDKGKNFIHIYCVHNVNMTTSAFLS